MVKCVELAKKVLKGIRAQCTQVTDIPRGVKITFTDNATDRRYSVTVVEETDSVLEQSSI
jgi:hypothetical protein